jgi:uncharacterized protein (TIGR00369 family)
VRPLADHFATESTRHPDDHVSARLRLHPGLADDAGAMRFGAVAYAVDVGAGLACGLSVVDQGLWVVTTDMDVRLTAPVLVGPLLVDTHVLRSGATTAVATFTMEDEGADRIVGGGTCTCRPFPYEFDPALLELPVGEVRRHGDGTAPPTEPLAQSLAFRIGEDASVEVDASPELRNPWGILHGGVTAVLADVASEVAGSHALGAPVRAGDGVLRYLAPGRNGPIRAVPRVLAVEDDRALVEVRVTDAGADDRIIAFGQLTLARR